VPSQVGDLMPPHLEYLRSYFGPRRFSPALGLALVFTVVLTALLGQAALAAPAGSAEAVRASLLFAMAALGFLEHVFLALPFRDGALWGWALPGRRNHLGA
jgi:putative photosynthetic complex assembly protein 2